MDADHDGFLTFIRDGLRLARSLTSCNWKAYRDGLAGGGVLGVHSLHEEELAENWELAREEQPLRKIPPLE